MCMRADTAKKCAQLLSLIDNKTERVPEREREEKKREKREEKVEEKRKNQYLLCQVTSKLKSTLPSFF